MCNFIYIIRQGNSRIFKIGVSKNPTQRCKSLQTGNPHGLKVIFTVPCNGVSAYQAESLIHNHLKTEKVKGEWFIIESDDRIVEIAQTMLNTLPKKSV